MPSDADQELRIVGIADVGREHGIVGRFLAQLMRFASKQPHQRIEPEQGGRHPRQQQLRPIDSRHVGELMGDDRLGIA